MDASQSNRCTPRHHIPYPLCRIRFRGNLWIVGKPEGNHHRYFSTNSYDFEKKTINSFLNKVNNINLIVIEGIFAKELSNTLCNQKHYFLELKINKNECMKRVVQRDIKERGKVKKQAEEDFLNSWDIYYQKFKNKYIKNNANEFTITNNTNVDQIFKKYLNEF